MPEGPLRKRVMAFVLPVIAGTAIVGGLVLSRQEPQQRPLQERTTPVRFIEVPQVDMVPRARAYGTVQPAKTWEAVAEVGGRIVEIHPRLKAGEFLPAGSVLVRIDSTDYELAVAETRAEIAKTQAQLLDNSVREANTRKSLVIEKESLALSERELERRRRLAAKGAAALSNVEQQERDVLSQKQSVTSHENALRLFPAERQSLEAQLARYEAQLARARHDLERTTIKLPFAARISRVNVEFDESVQVGDVLAVADDIGTAEIEAKIPLQVTRNLMASRDEEFDQIPQGDLGSILGVSATVRLPDFDIEWPGRLVRMLPTLDPETRTVGAVVEVKDPYRRVQPGVRPPLVKEMFVQVDLRGKPRPGSLVVPRTALHGDTVHLVDENNRLKVQPVEVGAIQPEFVSIKEGLRAGDRLVVSQLLPAIEGMRLEPQPDEQASTRLKALAQGGE